jgi:hypothetical protein
MKKNLNEESDAERINRLFSALISISIDPKNKNILVDKDIISPLLCLINNPRRIIYEDAIVLISNVCDIPCVEEKNNIIKRDVFTIFHMKLLEISPPLHGNINQLDYPSVKSILIAINNLLSSNPSGVSCFVKTPLIPVILSTLDSVTSVAAGSNQQNIFKIQRWICSCFLMCSLHSYEDMVELVNLKVVDKMVSLIELYVSQLKEIKSVLDENAVRDGSTIIFNAAEMGFNSSSASENNKFRNSFDSNNALNRLFGVFSFLVSLQSPSSLQRNIMNNVSVSLCLLLKKDKPPLSYGVVLTYINILKLSPSPPTGFNFSLAAQKAWNGMIEMEGMVKE